MTTPVARYFDRHARAYDRRYDHEFRQRLLRPSIPRLREHATALVRARPGARVFDAGCGPGRIGEAVLEAGAGAYVGVDVAAEMVELARRRLARFDGRAELVHGDVAELAPPGAFDVVLALGLFDYVPVPELVLERLAGCCSSVLLVSFPRWRPLRDRARTLVYGRRYGCHLEHYDAERMARVLRASGLDNADVVESRSGFRVTWAPASAGTAER